MDAVEGLTGDERLKELVEELNKIHVEGDDVVTLQQVRRAINHTVLRLPESKDFGVAAKWKAVQQFEEDVNNLAGFVPDWGFSEEDLRTSSTAS